MTQTELEMLAAGSGTTLNLTADQPISRGCLCCYAPQRGNVAHAIPAQANSPDTLPAKLISLGAVASGRRGVFLRRGIMKSPLYAAFPAKALLYVSQTVPGTLTAERPEYGFIQEVGVSLGGGWADFDPQSVEEC